MKKRYLAGLLCLILILYIAFPFNQKAHADGLTMSMITSAIYSIAQASGMNWSFNTANGPGAYSGLENEVNNWLGGRTIAETFGTELVRLQEGKLYVPMQVFNGAVSFLNSIAQMIAAGQSPVINGFVGDTPIGEVSSNFGVNNGSFYVCLYSNNGSVAQFQGAYNGVTDSAKYGTPSGGQKKDLTPLGYQVAGLQTNTSNKTRALFRALYLIDEKNTEGEWITKQLYLQFWGNYKDLGDTPISSPGIWNSENYEGPDLLLPGEAWAGQVAGAPDTNLDDYMDHIFDDAADNNLDVEGEVVPDVPPTPAPTPAPGIPDIIGGLDDVNESLDDLIDISGHIDTQTGVISGAIDQAVQDVADAIGEQTAALDESLSATAEGVETIAEALEDEEIDWQKFDLRGLFPFCIPFDIYNMLEALDASPTAPHVQLPFVIESIGFSYTIDLDFSAFDQVAAVMRTMELIVYGIALAWATSKVIKW